MAAKILRNWKDIPGYDGDYQVSSDGLVRSLKFGKERILKATDNQFGYLHLSLSRNSKVESFSITRLVAGAFLPNPENKRTVNHINGIKTDNRVENLEWATYSENNKHAHVKGLNDNVGEKNNHSRLTVEDVLSIRKRFYKEGRAAIAKEYNIDGSHAYRIATKKSWGHV